MKNKRTKNLKLVHRRGLVCRAQASSGPVLHAREVFFDRRCSLRCRHLLANNLVSDPRCAHAHKYKRDDQNRPNNRTKIGF